MAEALRPTALALQSPDARGVAAVGCRLDRQLETLEVRLLAGAAADSLRQAAELREAQKLKAFEQRTLEARIGAVEMRQAKLDSLLAELSDCFRQLHKDVSKQKGQLAGLQELRIQESLGSSWPRDAAKIQVAAQEGPPSSPIKAPFQHEGPTSSGDVVLLAVQELESLLRTELKAMSRRCALLQDTLDESVLLSIQDMDRRLQEQDLTVKRMASAAEECSARVEEHEFRIDVLRTKLEVNDQKMSRLERTRWSRASMDLSGSERASNSQACAQAAPPACVAADGFHRASASAEVYSTEWEPPSISDCT